MNLGIVKSLFPNLLYNRNYDATSKIQIYFMNICAQNTLIFLVWEKTRYMYIDNFAHMTPAFKTSSSEINFQKICKNFNKNNSIFAEDVK